MVRRAKEQLVHEVEKQTPEARCLSSKPDFWKQILFDSIVSVKDLALSCKFKIGIERLEKVARKYPIRINPYYLNLITSENDPIWKQCIPSTEELNDSYSLKEDPLCEERDSPVPGLTHRYPDRVLLLVSNQCAMYCRFCTRKRKVGQPFKRITKDQITSGINYIKSHTEVRDVLLSGGDPLLLSDSFLDWVLKEVKSIPHVEIVRIGTRVPCTLPQRVTPELCNMLKKHHPIFMNVHFNHPLEITEESRKACSMLADAGIPLGNQAVLMKGVNDDPLVMKELMQKLLTMRVKPYYIYQADMVKGTEHFRTKLDVGIKIIECLRGHTSGLAVPQFIVDAPGGGGKIPLLPEYLVYKSEGMIVLRNYEGKRFIYEEPKTLLLPFKPSI